MRLTRKEEIEKYILENGSASLDEICDRFKISKNTLRRDLDVIQKRGLIKKVYGGVKKVEDLKINKIKSLLSYSERAIEMSDEKEKICKLAANFIENGDIIFIDTGTSTQYLLKYINHLEDVTVITNSVIVMAQALEYPKLTIIGLPGILKRGTASLVGSGCVKYLKSYNIKKAFMACTGVSELGVSNASLEEYEIKKEVIKQSSQKFLLVDSSKFGVNSLMIYSDVDNFDYIVTDIRPKEYYMDILKKNGIKLEITK